MTSATLVSSLLKAVRLLMRRIFHKFKVIKTISGDVYNVGMSIVKGRLRHVVVKFPFIEKGNTNIYIHI